MLQYREQRKIFKLILRGQADKKAVRFSFSLTVATLKSQSALIKGQDLK